MRDPSDGWFVSRTNSNLLAGGICRRRGGRDGLDSRRVLRPAARIDVATGVISTGLGSVWRDTVELFGEVALRTCRTIEFGQR